ncbi:MAG: tetratricopeptide repeat protein, partial [Planctomycetes bacterium]|nr:tetratricopeptide repeat protein [Planctomycetota bacterium]
AIARDPELFDARLNYGKVLTLQNRLPAALEQFEVATRLAPDAFQAWNNCAAIHDAFGRGREAIAAAERAVAAAAARQAPEVAVLRERLAGYRRKWGG